MKTIILFAVACASAFAGQLTDSANVFGPRANEVNAALASSPVWIETRVALPAEGIKAYADAKAKEVTSKGFYVVITTQPREWRVSMNPIGMASSEGVRLAGDAMVARFKRGQFAEGAIGLSRDLVRLTEPRAAAVITQRQPVAPPAPKGMSNGEIWAWAVGSAFVVLMLMWWVSRLIARRSERIERERREERAAARAYTRETKATTPKQEEAQRLFDSYTPAERERLIERTTHHHHYSSGASTDPLMFWMLLNASQPHYYSPPVYVAPSAPSHYSPPAPEPERRRESSSDSSYSPPSYDSGSSSSYDSGSSSSSDSSGGGGSW